MATLRSTKVLMTFFLPTSISALSYHLLLGMAKTLWLSDEWTKIVNNVSQLPPPSAIATGTTPGSDCLMLAKTLRLSDKWTKTVRSVAQMPPPSATPDTPTDTAPGFDYDVSALCWGQRTISRCPASAPSITGQFVSNVFYNMGLYGVFAPGLVKLSNSFRSPPACSTGRPPPRTIMPPPITARGMG